MAIVAFAVATRVGGRGPVEKVNRPAQVKGFKASPDCLTTNQIRFAPPLDH
jgi:hypothetical protein